MSKECQKLSGERKFYQNETNYWLDQWTKLTEELTEAKRTLPAGVKKVIKVPTEYYTDKEGFIHTSKSKYQILEREER